MKIAHLSDPHILDLSGVDARRMVFSKRITGWVNLKLHRGSVHKRSVVDALLHDVRETAPDHVVVTGDLTNLALEPEFAAARAALAALQMHPSEVSIIPGNHDLYTRGAERSQRFMNYFAEHTRSDLPVGSTHPSGPFPFVRLRGPVAIIGLSSAVARLPLFAHGHVGGAQIESLKTLLAHPELKGRTPVVLIHHPLIDPPKILRARMHGLREAPQIREVLRTRAAVLVLHGHLHRRIRRSLGEGIELIGATSASLLDPHPDRMAGYNLYDFNDSTGALEKVTARVFQPESGSFTEAPMVMHTSALPG